MNRVNKVCQTGRVGERGREGDRETERGGGGGVEKEGQTDTQKAAVPAQDSQFTLCDLTTATTTIVDNNNNNNNDNNRKCAIRDFFLFFTISSLRREPSPTSTLMWLGRNRVQITSNTSSASCATWYEGTAQVLSLTELKSHLFELYFIGRNH